MPITRNLCIGAKPNEYGIFQLPRDGVITSLKLQNVNGTGVTCLPSAPLTKWGCDSIDYYNKDNIGVVVTDSQNKILYPSMKRHVNNGFFSIPGYNAYSLYVVFNSTNYTAYEGQELRLHYGETLFPVVSSDNSDYICVDIFAIIFNL